MARQLSVLLLLSLCHISCYPELDFDGLIECASPAVDIPNRDIYCSGIIEQEVIDKKTYLNIARADEQVALLSGTSEVTAFGLPLYETFTLTVIPDENLQSGNFVDAVTASIDTTSLSPGVIQPVDMAAMPQEGLVVANHLNTLSLLNFKENTSQLISIKNRTMDKDCHSRNQDCPIVFSMSLWRVEEERVLLFQALGKLGVKIIEFRREESGWREHIYTVPAPETNFSPSYPLYETCCQVACNADARCERINPTLEVLSCDYGIGNWDGRQDCMNKTAVQITPLVTESFATAVAVDNTEGKTRLYIGGFNRVDALDGDEVDPKRDPLPGQYNTETLLLSSSNDLLVQDLHVDGGRLFVLSQRFVDEEQSSGFVLQAFKIEEGTPTGPPLFELGINPRDFEDELFTSSVTAHGDLVAVKLTEANRDDTSFRLGDTLLIAWDIKEIEAPLELIRQNNDDAAYEGTHGMLIQPTGEQGTLLVQPAPRGLETFEIQIQGELLTR